MPYLPDVSRIDSVVTASFAAVTGSSIEFLHENQHRKGFYLYNDSPAVLFVKLEASGSTSDYTFQLPALSLYESVALQCPKTRVWGVWSSLTGSVHVTELS